MQGVEREVGVVPVDQRIVEADFDPLRTESFDILLHKVAPERCLRDLVVGELRVEHAEALVVLRREDAVLHARPLRGLRPLLRVEEVRVVVREIPVIRLVVEILGLFDPLMARRRSVKAEMNEHPEPVVDPPRHAGVVLLLRLVRDELRYFLRLRLGRAVGERRREGGRAA